MGEGLGGGRMCNSSRNSITRLYLESCLCNFFPLRAGCFPQAPILGKSSLSQNFKSASINKAKKPNITKEHEEEGNTEKSRSRRSEATHRISKQSDTNQTKQSEAKQRKPKRRKSTQSKSKAGNAHGCEAKRTKVKRTEVKHYRATRFGATRKQNPTRQTKFK